MEDYPYPVTVAGELGSYPQKTIKNKLQIYFQSKKKSGGGDCQVEYTGGGATVRFKSEEVRERVLAQDDHELTLENANVKLRLFLREEKPEEIDHGAEVVDTEPGVPEEKLVKLSRPTAVLLENIPEQLSREILAMMVENICNVSEEDFSLEIIRDMKVAVVTFSHESAAEQLLSKCTRLSRWQQYQLRCRVLEPSCSVRVERLPHQAVAELLELYFGKERQGGGTVVGITMIPEEQAAIITFQDPKVAETVLQKKHHICKAAVNVYPYHQELRTALYGSDRPEWKLPEAFTENLHPALGNFLLQEQHLNTIGAQMREHFCQVELSSAHAKLRPLPGLLKQKGLTDNHIKAWQGEALRVFRSILASYHCFECPMSLSVWKAAEKEMRQAVGEHAVLLPNLSNGVVAIAGLARDVNRIQQEVEEMVQRAAKQLERDKDGISDEVVLSPSMHYILQQHSLHSTFTQKYPALTMAYRNDAQRLVLSGLPAEVFAVKSWVLERKLDMKQRPLDLEPELLDFLRSVDCEEMSQNLFSSSGVISMCTVEDQGPELVAASEEALSKAAELLTKALTSRILVVEDEAVVRKKEWAELKKQLTGAYNSSGRSVVLVQLNRQGCVSVAGFQHAVQAVADSLAAFIHQHSRVEEAVPLRSLAVLVFLQEQKAPDWRRRAEAEEVSVCFQRRRLRVVLGGARLQVQGLKSLFVQLDSALYTDQLTIIKPGVRKCFLEKEQTFSLIMKEKKCVVILLEEGPPEEEEAEEEEEGGRAVCCHVRMDNGVLVMVSKGDITRFAADAVVNAANEDLQHIGGLAWALLKAAGQQLQDTSDAYVRKNGRLRPGEAAITPAGNLPCKHVVHAVGPRYSSADHSRCVQQLARSVSRSLALAQEHGCTSIAMPAISSGIFGFPLQLCAETIAKAVREHCLDYRSNKASLSKIHLVNNDDKTVQAMTQAVKTVFADMRPQMLSQPRRSTGAEWRSERTPPAAAELSSSLERHRTSTEHSRDSTSDSRDELETKHTKEGLEIVLRKGNIEDASTDVIVNTISVDLDLSTGAVSKALLQAAGPQLQGAIQQQARKGRAQYGDVLHTDGFHLASHIFHVICPFWDAGKGRAPEMLALMVKTCLKDAEKQRAKSLALPAIGAGNLGFPKPLVAKIMLSEVQAFSHKKAHTHLRKVVFVVHPSDTEIAECFVREFRGQAQGHRGPSRPPSSQSKQDIFPTGESQQAFFGQISNPALGVHSMKIGHLTLEVSSGEITRETTDIIVNSSNHTFSLKSGVSKAILEAAGPMVEEECAQLGSLPHKGLIVTQGGRLRCGNIVHTVVPADPAKIKDVVFQVLQVCEESKAGSVAFPALGTGQGGTSPLVVAEAMISAVTDFVTKKMGRYLRFVKIVIFQPEMISHFHKSMKKREGGGQPVEKSMLHKVKDTVSSFLMGGGGETRSEEEDFVWVGEEFSPTVFQLCGESMLAVASARDELKDLLMKEQMERTLQDPAMAQLTPQQRHAVQDLQRRLAVRIQLDARGIHLEGLTRDVLTAETQIQRLIREAEVAESQRREAVLLRDRVEWQYEHRSSFVPFNINTNLMLEKAFENQQSHVIISINDLEHEANLVHKKAFRLGREVILKRTELKGAFPNAWARTENWGLQVGQLQKGSAEYQDVEAQFRWSGITNYIVEIVRIQNEHLRKAYEMKKESLDKNSEQRLFHGTHAPFIDQINQRGFNRAYASDHGTLGKGFYFATDPKTAQDLCSKPDAQGHKHMYLALVLVGKFTTGNQTMSSPPPRNSGKSAAFYDSVVDNVANPTVFVIFDGVQAYPQYLIKFK